MTEPSAATISAIDSQMRESLARKHRRQAARAAIRFAFNSHGLGDCVHAATALRLYVAAGYDLAIKVEENKRWVWQAAGVPIYDAPDELPLHPYHYPDLNRFWDLATPDHTYSKIAHLFEIKELPRLGTKEEVWSLVCAERIDARPHVSPEAMAEARRFLDGLPKPIVLLHTKGTNWQTEKSIPDGTAFALILELIDAIDGSIVTLDWDRRAPTLGHERVRSLRPYAGRMDTEVFAALCMLSDLLIGIDSGPFHLAQWLGIPSLYVTRQIPPVRCSIPSPDAIYLVPAKDRDHWASRGPEWRFTEFRGTEATATEIAIAAIHMLAIQQIKESSAMQLTEESVIGLYTYRRCGHDERSLMLNPNGQIGDGAAGCERIWKIIPLPIGGQALAIYGDGNRDTCHLQMCADGVLRGRWLHNERMPIELIRITPPVTHVVPDGAAVVTWDDLEPVTLEHHEIQSLALSDGQIHRWTPDEATALFPAYQRDWNTPVGSRGNGMVWLLDPRIERSDLDACGVDHEDWIYPHLAAPAGAVCLDLASFVGTNAVWWAQSGVKVIAVEPVPVTRETLERNLILNGVADMVRVIPKAFGEKVGTARMKLASYASMFSADGEIEVPVTTVDHELLHKLDRLDIVKLDVEGAECDVIHGAWHTLSKFKPKLIIEVHSHYPGYESNGDILARQLKALGYTWRCIWSNSPAYYYIECLPVKS